MQHKTFHRGCELGPEQQKKRKKKEKKRKKKKKKKKEKRGELECFDAL